VWSKTGLLERSVEELRKHHEALKATWSIVSAEEAVIPEVGLDEFCRRLVRHVE
jgi:hypothetical protein